MKLTSLLMTLFLLQVSAAGLAQKVSIPQGKLPASKVFTEIKKQTGYRVIWPTQLFDAEQSFDVSFNNLPLEQAMTKLLENKPFTFTLVNKTIVIKAKEATFLEKVKEALSIPILVTGRVTDSTGVALPGATIKIKGSGKTVNTDINGGFKFNAEEGAEVSVSFVGYQTTTFKVSNDMGFQSVVLKAFSGELKEVTVHTGYQDLPKERATGSFEVIDSKKINEQVGSNIFDRLKGISSLLFDPSNSNSATPFTIRGLNTINATASPLIVVDNFPYDGDINNINPNTIESVTVLKDAAAASIWGARAGNGVLVITKKKEISTKR